MRRIWGRVESDSGGRGDSRPFAFDVDESAAAAAADDVKLPGSGEKLPGARWGRDGCIV